MLLPLLLSLAPFLAQDDPTVTVRLNRDQFEVGERGRVYVRAARDGYLVILHADPQGRVRVLFPIDPGEDNFVRGGKELELRSRSDREALQMDGDGSGTVLAVFSLDAFMFDELTRNGHWDFLALGGPDESVKNDPLAGLLEIANNMARANPYDYDAATYVVGSGRYAAEYGYEGGAGGHSHLGIHLAFGYYPFGFGFSYGYPFYDPFYFVPFWGWYGGYGYGGYGHGYPAYRAPVFYSGFNRKTVDGLTRFESTQPRSRGGFSEPLSTRSRGVEPRARSVQPRSRSAPSRSVAPRGSQSRLSFGDRSSISRSFGRNFGGIGRSFGGFGGSRGAFGGFTGGGRGVGARRR